MEVHNELGSGFLEPVYQDALALEFKKKDILFKKEQQLKIFYKGIKLERKYIADFICYEKIIVELKALKSLNTEHESQLLNYLKATGYKLDILINFGESQLKFKRFVL
jgi:GxxExxY protein